jgi:hypothetical protein
MTLESAKAEALTLKHYEFRHGMVPYVYRTYKRHGRGWRALHNYGIRFHKVGNQPDIYEDREYRMVPVA